jgi:SAM-dependent methyltransferase
LKKSKQEWFSEWFDSPYYHVLYKHRDKDDAAFFIDHLFDYLQPKKASKVLDLACGKGRHAKYIHKKGYDVTGLDLSENSINLAQSIESEGLHFDVHDMRELYKKEEFDLILNLFTSFGYFDTLEDERKTLNVIYQGLKPGGHLVIDYLNALKVERTMVHEEVILAKGIDFHIQRKLKDGLILKNIQFEDQGKTYEFTERVKDLRLPQFKFELELAGFSILGIFGGHGMSPFHEIDSDRLILVAQKR